MITETIDALRELIGQAEISLDYRPEFRKAIAHGRRVLEADDKLFQEFQNERMCCQRHECKGEQQ